MSWDHEIEIRIKQALGRDWVESYFPYVRVMDLRDGSWLQLGEHLLRLYPGTSGREESVWVEGTDPDQAIQQLTGEQK
jgi:hypothetical protein